MRKLTDLQWAIICTVYLQPNYQFTGDERRAAERMRARKLLKAGKDKTYTVTKLGEQLYGDANAV